MVALQLPDGASLGRTEAALGQVSRIARAIPGVDHVVEISGISALDNNASLSSAGAAYVILKDWGERGQARNEGLRAIYERLQGALDSLPDGSALVVVPPPIQGIGNSSGFTMEVELRDGNFDWQKLQADHRDDGRRRVLADGAAACVLPVPRRGAADHGGCRPHARRRRCTSGWATCSMRSRAMSGRATSTSSTRSGGPSRSMCRRTRATGCGRPISTGCYVRSTDGNMVPLGALVTIRPTVGPALISAL